MKHPGWLNVNAANPRRGKRRPVVAVVVAPGIFPEEFFTKKVLKSLLF